jgi:conjugative transposon protein TcpC
VVSMRAGRGRRSRGLKAPGAAAPDPTGPSPGLAVPAAAAPGSSVPAEPARPRLDQAWKVKLAQVAIVGAVALGAVTGPLALVAGVRPATDGGQGPQATPSVGPEGFAELYLRSYLNQGDEDRPELLEAFYPDARDGLDGMRAGHYYVAQTATLRARQVGDGYWSIMVAAELLEMTERGAQSAGTDYYLVSVYERDGRYVATSLPAQVPTPRSMPVPALAAGKLSPPAPGDPVAAALQRFFDAFLVGQGELSRYIDPASGIRAISPSPFASVKLRRMSRPAAGAGPVVVMAEVAGTNAAGQVRVMHYNLELEQSNSRWEVRGLLVTPQLAPSKG